MKKFRNPLVLLALGATAICGLSSICIKTSPLEAGASIGSYTTDKATYYQSITSTGSTLLTDLHNLMIDTHQTYTSYDDLKKPDYVYQTDPGSSSSFVRDFYTQKDIGKSWGSGGVGTWNREHVWAKSTSSGTFVESGAGSDFQHLRPVESKLNSTRGSRRFGTISNRDSCKAYSGYNNDLGGYVTGSDSDGTFEPLDGAKGDVARTILYVYMHYSNSLGKTNTYTGPLSLTKIIQGGSMDKAIELLVEWSLVDKVDETEIIRNEAAASFQGNRNPFIDHPSYACKIWGTSGNVKNLCDKYDGWKDDDDPTPETKTLEKIEVTTEAPTKQFYVGDKFDTSGLVITATYDDDGTKSYEDVTSKVSISPDTLSLGTQEVTFSYTYNNVTKSTTYNKFTVSERPGKNYGTFDNPLSVSDAKLLIEDECPSSGNYTKQQLYIRGEVGSTITDDSTHNRKKIYVNNPNSLSSTMIVESLNMTKEQYDVLEKGDEIIFHGYGYNNNGSDYIKYKDSYDPILDRNISKEAVVPVDSVTITNTKTDYYIGDTCEISATFLPNNATTKSLTYSSNNTSVATVNNAGEVSFKAAGSVTITASSNNNKTDAITFNVTKRPVPVESVIATLQPQSTSFYVGDTANIVYKVLPENADNKHVSFSSSRGSVASVDDLGNVTFNEIGTAVISVISDDNYEARADITVNVVKQPVEYIPVTQIKVPSEISLSLNEEKTIGIEILPENATDKSVSWSSSDERTAIVDDTGKITGIDYGEADIVVTSNDNEDIKATIKVTVLRPITKELVEIEIENKPTKLLYDVGEEFTTAGLEVYAHYIDGTKVDITSECTVSTPDLSEAGTKVVDVTYKNGFKASFTVAVVESIGELSCEKLPLKTEYFASESFNPIGLVVKAKVNGTDQDVTSLLTYSYNFKNNPNVKAILGGRNITITVTILEGEITNEHKAADFTYIFKDKMTDVETANVSLSDWKSLEYKYNQLDEASKTVLKQAVTAYSNGQVSAANEDDTTKIKECVANYDEIYLAHKAEGFSDFMNRNPKAPSPTPDPTPKSNKLTLIITIAASAVVLIVVLIVVIVVASKKRGKKHA